VAASVSVLSATAATAVTPPHAAGAVDIQVTQNGTTQTLQGAFTYQ
jgi:hypothetical protein